MDPSQTCQHGNSSLFTQRFFKSLWDKLNFYLEQFFINEADVKNEEQRLTENKVINFPSKQDFMQRKIF